MSAIAVWSWQIPRILGVYHFGVLCPDGYVIHFVKEKRWGPTIIKRTDRTTFSDGRRVYNVVTGEKDVNKVTNRAMEQYHRVLAGQGRAYSLPYYNCETFALYCATGEAYSSQVEDVSRALKLGFVNFMLLSYVWVEPFRVAGLPFKVAIVAFAVTVVLAIMSIFPNLGLTRRSFVELRQGLCPCCRRRRHRVQRQNQPQTVRDVVWAGDVIHQHDESQ